MYNDTFWGVRLTGSWFQLLDFLISIPCPWNSEVVTHAIDCHLINLEFNKYRSFKSIHVIMKCLQTRTTDHFHLKVVKRGQVAMRYIFSELFEEEEEERGFFKLDCRFVREMHGICSCSECSTFCNLNSLLLQHVNAT